VGIAELKAEWDERNVLDAAAEWDALREETVPLYRQALDQFLDGTADVATFRTSVDSLSKSQGWFGFRGTGQMFFNQLVKAADLEDLTAALKAALPAPADEEEAKAKLEAFQEAVDRARDRAETTGATKPGGGRINFFISFFWELVDRKTWPTFFPNSRNILEEHGLLDTSQPQPDLYIAYRRRIEELKATLETTTWGVEHLLWDLGQGAAEAESSEETSTEEAPEAQTEPVDLYASYRAQGLYFPDEVVTSLVLSLATKRFVILTGISGTGKTKIALGLARHLGTGEDTESAEVEPPTSDDDNVFIPITAGKLNIGRTTLDLATRTRIGAQIGLPDRGGSKRLKAKLPDGSIGNLRLNNIALADERRELYLLFFLKDANAWLGSNAKPGDFLHLTFDGGDGADFALNIAAGAPTAIVDGPQRYALIAVRSDWTDPRGLVGFFNPLTNSYVRTAVIDVLLRAAEDPAHPYLVILDEMNLARVEYYFSDFLSALESDEPIQMMDPGVEEELLALGHDEIPAQLKIPPNVSFLGTVNVDETTQSFSPKVLDRANVIEFSDVDIERALGHPVDDPTEGLRLSDGQLNPAWLCTAREHALAAATTAQENETFTEALEDVHDLLTRFHLQFGYRVIAEVSAFVGHAMQKVAGATELIVHRAFDLQLQQKVIPKLTGGRELEQPLTHLLHYCHTATKSTALDPQTVRDAARKALDPTDTTGVDEPQYPGSAKKLLRMLDRLADTGFVGALE
jgi:hypothetical protein